MHYHRVMNEEIDTTKEWHVSNAWRGHPVHWRPGYGLPSRWKTTLDRDDLPYLVELEFTAGDNGPSCHAIRFAAHDSGSPIGARDIRKVPIGECIQLAIASAAIREERRPGEIAYQLGGGDADMTAQTRMARPRDKRTSDEHLHKVAEIYRHAGEKPTQAVQDEWSWPISYPTAARWVTQARQRGFLSPTTRGRGGTSDTEEN
jgi:hypothetical protein